MDLSRDIVNRFIKATTDKQDTSSEMVVYGTVVDETHVQIDGSTFLTPIARTTEIEVGSRVSVMIKDHVAVVNGNFDHPSINDNYVTNANNAVIQTVNDTIDAQIEEVNGVIEEANNRTSVSLEDIRTRLANATELLSDEDNFEEVKRAFAVTATEVEPTRYLVNIISEGYGGEIFGDLFEPIAGETYTLVDDVLAMNQYPVYKTTRPLRHIVTKDFRNVWVWHGQILYSFENLDDDGIEEENVYVEINDGGYYDVQKAIKHNSDGTTEDLFYVWLDGDTFFSEVPNYVYTVTDTEVTLPNNPRYLLKRMTVDKHEYDGQETFTYTNSQFINYYGADDAVYDPDIFISDGVYESLVYTTYLITLTQMVYYAFATVKTSDGRLIYDNNGSYYVVETEKRPFVDFSFNNEGFMVTGKNQEQSYGLLADDSVILGDKDNQFVIISPEIFKMDFRNGFSASAIAPLESGDPMTVYLFGYYLTIRSDGSMDCEYVGDINAQEVGE